MAVAVNWGSFLLVPPYNKGPVVLGSILGPLNLETPILCKGQGCPLNGPVAMGLLQKGHDQRL